MEDYDMTEARYSHGGLQQGEGDLAQLRGDVGQHSRSSATALARSELREGVWPSTSEQKNL